MLRLSQHIDFTAISKIAIFSIDEIAIIAIFDAMANSAGEIIGRFGGNKTVAEIVSVHPTRVSNWKRPRDKGGTGGIIPQRHWPKLLAFAQANGIDLSPSDFINIEQGGSAS